ncbi:putative peptide-N(4)-(N-acetyl-beta-glucosaminyl)asparagine amidase [Helianthus annuus]|nr:putative peptide-N(4)-(N-acetyl-beta-glucosaminyl)asparagine amidase [Helianthus annuus]
MNAVNLLLILPLFFTITLPHSVNSVKQNSSNETIPQHFFEVTLPLPTDNITPSCSVNLLNHTFTNTTNSSSVTVNYTTPPDKCHWSVAVLDFKVKYNGEQDTSNGIAGVWINGVELLRTTTPQPSENGSFWNIRKDVSKYSSIITHHNLTLSVVLQNLMKHDVNGVYNVSVSFLFYSDVKFPLSLHSGESGSHSLNRKLMSFENDIKNYIKNCENEDKLGFDRVIKSSYPYDPPADLIIPLSEASDDGFWFKIHDESEIQTKNVRICPKTYKAVLELYVSFHGDDEFWYMNPPDSYIKSNDLPFTNGKGSYREVLVTIDGKLAGTVIPFPVIYSGGINPLFWKPVVSIGAFDIPSYDIDLTSYLGLLLDNRNHSIGFQVADGGSFWLVDANMHLWIDDTNVQAIVEYEPPSMEIEHDYEFEGLDGTFETEVERSMSSIRMIQSSKGILKTKVTEEIKFKNKLKFKDDGTRKELEQKIKTKTKVKTTDTKGHSVGEIVIEKTYPLKITIANGRGSSRVNTTVVQGRSVSFSDEVASISRVLNHDLNCTGWIMAKGNSGFAENHQSYSYDDGEGGCYSRTVDVVKGDVIADETTSNCVK